LLKQVQLDSKLRAILHSAAEVLVGVERLGIIKELRPIQRGSLFVDRNQERVAFQEVGFVFLVVPLKVVDHLQRIRQHGNLELRHRDLK
jgi:hypothetical protein